MRRRVPELRRPGRRKLWHWIWLLFGIFLIAVFVLFVVHHHHQDLSRLPVKVGVSQVEKVQEIFNITHELLSSTSFARELADQMTLAKAFVVLSKEHNNLQLAWELSSEIRNCQRLLSQAAVRERPITYEEAHPIISKLAQLIYKAHDSHYDISTTITTLMKHVHALEGRVIAAVAQSVEFGRLASESVPTVIHCLNIKLTREWYGNTTIQNQAAGQKNLPRLVDNNLHHFCLFSDNVLAASVVINSTVSNADHPRQLVFHVVTSEISYQPMITWFLVNDFGGCTVEVRSIKEFSSWLNASYSPLLSQLLKGYIDSNGAIKENENIKFRSLLSHLWFYIPEIHPFLEKVVFLDEDVVVRKDLTPLFSLDLHGNVNGAVETCLESFHRFYKYLNFSNPLLSSKFDPQACGWASGMNVLDLVAWKKANLTAIYDYWQEQNAEKTLWKSGTLAPGLLTFYGHTEPLDRRWHATGLGYDVDIDDRRIESSAVLHFNGNLKPWTRLAINRYKNLWVQYIDQSHPFVKDCTMY